MQNRIIRHRHRTLRNLLRACTAMLIGAMLMCTGILVSVGATVHTELRDMDKRQEDILNTLMWHRLYTEDLELEAVEPAVQSLGTFKITHYCPCVKCCGKSDGITYTGTKATAGRTIGVDPDVIPLGSTVYIGGQAYVAEDIGGGIKGNRIDMYVESHSEAIEKGVYDVEVFV